MAEGSMSSSANPFSRSSIMFADTAPNAPYGPNNNPTTNNIITNKIIKNPHGIILVAGATGTGKSTTVYS